MCNFSPGVAPKSFNRVQAPTRPSDSVPARAPPRTSRAEMREYPWAAISAHLDMNRRSQSGQ